MRSRSFLLHDSHLTSSINHHELADTRALQQIKSLSIIRLISLALLLAVSVTACSSGKTKPRGMGIGLRNGAIYDYSYIEGRDGKEYTDKSQAINKYDSARFPVFFQFDENLFGNWAYGEAVVDFSPMRRENLPPKLQKSSYGILTDNATTDFDLDSSFTNITEFRSAYPEYASKIDAATNPTISADYDISMATLGYNVGLFVPVSENHRIMTVGAGVGLSYLNGGYSVNLCDPFRISLEKKDLTLGGSSKQGFCQNKQELANFQISEFRASGNAKFIVYSYVGENFEFNAITSDQVVSSSEIINKQRDFRAELKPNYMDMFNIVYRF